MDIRESLDTYFKLVEDPRSKAHITYGLSNFPEKITKPLDSICEIC